MILENLEFDGSTVLCRVCGDKASGFHYGVHACEGCKGFFRRSIQQKIQYRPCLKNQQCNIMRVNRNRCQYCRLKKCIAVGMSRDAVRFGRVPKKEKAKIMEQMKRVNAQSQMNALNSSLENDPDFLSKIIKAHYQNSDYVSEKVKELLERAWMSPQFVNCPAHMACPLNPKPDVKTDKDGERWEEFSEYFTPAIRNVVNFAKSIPGFQMFSQEDQVSLLKAGTFEVLLVHLAPLFDAKHNTMMFANGKLFKRAAFSMTSNAGFLLDSMFDFSERMNALNLNDEEIALFSAAVIVTADRPGLRNIDLIEKVQRKIQQGLQAMLKINHPDDHSLFPKLLMKIPDLRTLNTLHSEKLLGMTVAANGQPIQDIKDEIPLSRSPSDTSDRVDSVPKPMTCPFSSGPKQPAARFPGYLGMPFPHQFPMAAPMPFPEYRREMLQNAYAMYSRFPQQPVYPALNNKLDAQRPELSPEKLWNGSQIPVLMPRHPWDVNNMTDVIYKERNSGKTDINSSEVSPVLRKDSYLNAFNTKTDSICSPHTISKSPVSDVLDVVDDIDVENSDFNDNKAHTSHLSTSSSPEPLEVDLEENGHSVASPGLTSEKSGGDEEPSVVCPVRKRSIAVDKCPVEVKIPKLQALCEYDMRSTRSNSISSSTSVESMDSAYRTISSPGTPRSLCNPDARSPYPSMVKNIIKDTIKAVIPEEESENESRDIKKDILPLRSDIDDKIDVCSEEQIYNHDKHSGKDRIDVVYESESSEKNILDVPVLKQALAMPPLCAQDTWFYNPTDQKCQNKPVVSDSGSSSQNNSGSESNSSSRCGSPKSGNKQFKLKQALLERFSPNSMHGDDYVESNGQKPIHDNVTDVENLSVPSRNNSPMSLKNRLLNRVERRENEREIKNQDVQKSADLIKKLSPHNDYTPMSYHNMMKSQMYPPVSSNLNVPKQPHPAYMGLPYQPLHPVLMYQYQNAMQQQFKTLQQMEAHRQMVTQAEKSSPKNEEHALNLAIKKEPL